MADETSDTSRRSDILKDRAKRRSYNQPHIPWYAKVWNWFLPGTYRQEDRRRNRNIVISVICFMTAMILIIVYNVFLSPMANRTKIIVADGVFASGQEQNIINDFESQGFRDAAYEDGLGVVAYGTDDMVAQYRESFGKQYLDEATEILTQPHDGIGVITVVHSEGWDTISVSTYTEEVDIDLFQYIFTNDQDFTNALEEWIAWGTMQNGKPVTISMLDATGSRYFEADGISSVADILTEVKNSNPEGIDWDEVTENISQQGSEDGTSASEATDEPATKETSE